MTEQEEIEAMAIGIWIAEGVLVKRHAKDWPDQLDDTKEKMRRLASGALTALRSRAPQAGADLEAKAGPEWKSVYSLDEMQAFFRSKLPAIREAARGCGYAIGVHGSERRDFDLIAVPWVEQFSSPDELARAVMMAASGFEMGEHRWEQKPNGRIAVSLPICWPEWKSDALSLGMIDLSVVETALRSERERAQTEVVRDGARFRDFAPEPRAEIPEGYSAPLDTKTTRTLMTERAQTAVPDAGADVRERALQLAVRTWTPWSVSVDLDKRTDTIASALVSYGEQRAREEREECAKIADETAASAERSEWKSIYENSRLLVEELSRAGKATARTIATAIRARKEKTDV